MALACVFQVATRANLVSVPIERQFQHISRLIGGASCLVWRGMGQTESLQIESIDKDLKKMHRVCCIAIVIKTVRKKPLLLAIWSRDRAHLSPQEQWCCVSYKDI